MSSKTFKSVKSLLKGMGIDPSGVMDNIDKHKISKGMIVRRIKANITQKKLAKILGKPVDWVERIETLEDSDMGIYEIKQYYDALGYNVSLAVRPKKNKD